MKVIDVLALDDIQRQKNISSSELAKLSGVSYATVCDLKKGSRKTRSITVMRIARALGVTEKDITKGE